MLALSFILWISPLLRNRIIKRSSPSFLEHAGTSLWAKSTNKRKLDKLSPQSVSLSNVDEFISNLRKLSFDSINNKISQENKDILITQVDNFLPLMSPTAVAAIVLNTGTILSNSKARNTKGQESVLLLKHVTRVLDELTAPDLAMALVGLARCGGTLWDRMMDDQPRWDSAIARALPIMDSRNVGDAVWSLGSMGARWTQLSPTCRKALTGALLNKCKEKSFSSHSLASALWALAKMNAKLQPGLCSSIVARLEDIGIDLSPQQSSKVIWALGTLGIGYREIPPGLLALLLLKVNSIKKSQTGFAVSASQTLTGVAKSGATWDVLDVASRRELGETFTRVCNSLNTKGIANGVWAMGSLDFPAAELSPQARESMAKGLLKVAADSNAWSLVNTVWGVAKMGMTWGELPEEFVAELVVNLERVQKDLNAIDVGILLWTLGSMDCDVATFPANFTASLLGVVESLLPQMNGQELSRTVWGLSAVGLSWDGLPVKFRVNVKAALERPNLRLEVQDAGSLAYGVAMLCFDSSGALGNVCSELHHAVLSIVRNLDVASLESRQETEQLLLFAQYVRALRSEAEASRIPKYLLDRSLVSVSWATSLKNPLPDIASRNLTYGSRLQTEVIKGLREALSSDDSVEPLRVQGEYSSFNGIFPVDAAVIFRGKVAALVEVDGPHHYRGICSPETLRRKDLLKQRMYGAVHPNVPFHRVTWLETNKHGARVVGGDLAAVVSSAQRKTDSEDKTLAGVARFAVSNFLSSFEKIFLWSLRNNEK